MVAVFLSCSLEKSDPIGASYTGTLYRTATTLLGTHTDEIFFGAKRQTNKKRRKRRKQQTKKRAKYQKKREEVKIKSETVYFNVCVCGKSNF